MVACEDDLGRLAHCNPTPRFQRLRCFVDDDTVKCRRMTQKLVPAAGACGCYNSAGGENFSHSRSLSLPEFLAQQLQLLQPKRYASISSVVQSRAICLFSCGALGAPALPALFPQGINGRSHLRFDVSNEALVVGGSKHDVQAARSHMSHVTRQSHTSHVTCPTARASATHVARPTPPAPTCTPAPAAAAARDAPSAHKATLLLAAWLQGGG